MIYTDAAAVQTGHPSLTADFVVLELDAIISEASQNVRDDIAGFLDLNAIDLLMPVPAQIIRLATYKARELAYRLYYGSSRPQISEIDNLQKDYKQLLSDIRDGRIDMPYRKSSNSDKQFIFI